MEASSFDPFAGANGAVLQRKGDDGDDERKQPSSPPRRVVEEPEPMPFPPAAADDGDEPHEQQQHSSSSDLAMLARALQMAQFNDDGPPVPRQPAAPPALATSEFDDSVLHSVAPSFDEHDEHASAGMNAPFSASASMAYSAANSAELPPPPPPPPFQSAVGSTTHRGEGMRTVTRYSIITRWTQPPTDGVAASAARASPAGAAAFPGGSPIASPTGSHFVRTEVQRRFNDFVFVQTLLSKLYPSSLIPCLPASGLVEDVSHHVFQRSDVEFVQQRRRGLLRFLQEVALLPLALHSVVRDFLCCNAEDWAAARTRLEHEHGLGQPLASSVLQMGARLLATATRQLQDLREYATGTAVALPPAAQSDHDQPLCARSLAHHQRLGQLYGDAHAQLSAVVAAEHTLAVQWASWYPGFAEEDDASQARRVEASRSLLGLGAAAFLPLTQRAATLRRSQSNSGAALSELLGHHAGMLQQLAALLERREALSLSLREADAESLACSARVGLLNRQRAVGAEPVSAEDLRQASAAATRASAICRDRTRVLSEFHVEATAQVAAYTARRRAEVARALAAFVQAQISNEKNSAKHFADMLEQVEAAEREHSALPASKADWNR